MLQRRKLSKKYIVFLSVTFVTIVLGMQLVAATAWTADAANSGPGITIIQLSQDEGSDWATQDLVNRLSEFIRDDPFFHDRIEVIKTNDPYVAESITDKIVVYVSHGGPIGIVTGNHLTSWRTMAEIVTESNAIMHLFTSCYSRNIIKYGNGESGEKLYTVPGARPAEVTNIEITTTIMLALGIDTKTVEQYRRFELKSAKESIEGGQIVHIMDFEQIILDEIEAIDASYEDTWTDTYRVYRFSEEELLEDSLGFNELPEALRDMITQYFRNYLDASYQLILLPFYDCRVTYVRNYYYEAEWIPDVPPIDPDEPPIDPDDPPDDPNDPPIGPESLNEIYLMLAPEGHWEYGPNIFSGGTYSGFVSYGNYNYYHYVLNVNVTASGPTIDANGVTEIDSMSLEAIAPKGTYVTREKVDGAWLDPVVGRDPARTGGLWTDSANKVDYEYEPGVLPIPHPSSTGNLYANGEYYYFTSIPASGTDWHGPTYVKTLPSYFRLSDLGSLSANLSLVHDGDGFRESQTLVSLYDENMKIVLALAVTDSWSLETGGEKQYFSVIHYKADGSCTSMSSEIFSGEMSGIVTARYDSQVGIWIRTPGDDYERLLITHNLLDKDRIIKYAALSSFRYGWRQEHDERIYNIRLSYAASEQTSFHDNCNDMDNFIRDLDFGFGAVANGTFSVPYGESYITLTNVESGSGWHGPNYVRTLDRPFRLYQLDELSVLGGIVQTSNSPMGKTYVALFDENMQITFLIYWGDSWIGDDKSYFYINFYPESGSAGSQSVTDIQGSFEKIGKLWWDDYNGGQGAIFSTIDGSGGSQPLAECVNASRVIKYAVLLGYQYDSYAFPDMRIQDINILADPNRRVAPPPFIDDCDDNDKYELDLSFPYGVVTTGELSEGSGYLYPSGIPDSPTGWHGPNFVYELNNPFRLGDLSEFSVNGELVQHSGQMGKMLVALFDENMQIALLVYWGDSWAWSNKGYFHVVYYPQGGGSFTDTTPTTTLSFDRTGKLWVHEGSMKYDIAGIESGDMGAIVNPQRMMKYLVIHADRSGDYTLSDLRLDKIVIAQGLQTEPQPIYADASYTGACSEGHKNKIDFDAINAAQSNVVFSWDGPWPRLILSIVYGAYILFSIAIDLLLTVTILEEAILTYLDLQFGIPDELVEFWLLLFLSKLDDFVLWITAQLMYLASLGFFMVYDFTKVPGALALGLALWVSSATITYLLSLCFYESFGDYLGAAIVWLSVLLFVVFLPLKSSPMISGRMNRFILSVCQAIESGHPGLRGGYFRKRGHITWLMMILMGVVSLGGILYYCNLYVNS